MQEMLFLDFVDLNSKPNPRAKHAWSQNDSNILLNFFTEILYAFTGQICHLNIKKGQSISCSSSCTLFIKWVDECDRRLSDQNQNTSVDIQGKSRRNTKTSKGNAFKQKS